MLLNVRKTPIITRVREAHFGLLASAYRHLHRGAPCYRLLFDLAKPEIRKGNVGREPCLRYILSCRGSKGPDGPEI